jgi:hypothetical protein
MATGSDLLRVSGSHGVSQPQWHLRYFRYRSAGFGHLVHQCRMAPAGTTLRCIMGLLKPEAGEIRLFGAPPAPPLAAGSVSSRGEGAFPA